MFEAFDIYGQWFFLHIVYQYESWVFPVVAGLLLWRGRQWWTAMKTLLLILTLFYLLLFRMHWYSSIAWPLMLATFAFDWSRYRWYRVLGFGVGGAEGTLAEHARQWPAMLRQQSLVHNRRWLAMALAVVIGVPLIIHRLSIPLDLIILLATVMICAVLLTWWFTIRANDQRRFNRYVDRDPRMVQYLNWTRSLRADKAHAQGSVLANNRMFSDE